MFGALKKSMVSKTKVSLWSKKQERMRLGLILNGVTNWVEGNFVGSAVRFEIVLKCINSSYLLRDN